MGWGCCVAWATREVLARYVSISVAVKRAIQIRSASIVANRAWEEGRPRKLAGTTGNRTMTRPPQPARETAVMGTSAGVLAPKSHRLRRRDQPLAMSSA